MCRDRWRGRDATVCHPHVCYPRLRPLAMRDHERWRSETCAVVACLVLTLGSGSQIQGAASRAQLHVVRGVAALHNFEYEEANEAFRQAQTLDPTAVVAYW